MATYAPLRPPTCEPSELATFDASKIAVKIGPKWITINYAPNLLLKGTAKFVTAGESGKLRLGLSIAKENAESVSTFCQSKLLPALATALAIPEPTATPLGRQSKTTTPTRPPIEILPHLGRQSKKSPKSALQLRFCYTLDKYDDSQAIVNMTANSITTYHRVNMDIHTVIQVDSIDRMAATEVTAWLSISKSDKEEGLYYVNILPKTVVFAPPLHPVDEVKPAPAITFGGELFN